jgi:hypothetical protein
VSRLLPYREDAVGLTRLAWAWAVLPAIVTVVILLFTPFPKWIGEHNAPALSTFSIFVVILPPFVAFLTAGIAVFHCWLPGIRVTDAEVRIGNCKGAERRRQKGKPPARVSPRWRTTFVEFAVPVDAIRSARIIPRESLRCRVRQAWSHRGEAPPRRRNLVGLVSPFSHTVLELRVDLARAHLPDVPPHIFSQLANHRTNRYFVLTDSWTISTRRADQLRDALEAAGIPAEQPAESLLAVAA